MERLLEGHLRGRPSFWHKNSTGVGQVELGLLVDDVYETELKPVDVLENVSCSVSNAGDNSETGEDAILRERDRLSGDMMPVSALPRR